MTPVAVIAARLMPGGEWHRRFRAIAVKTCAWSADARDELLSDTFEVLVKSWHRYDPTKGSEWAYTRQLIRSAASKRRSYKGAIASPRYCNQKNLAPHLLQGWKDLRTAPLDHPAAPGSRRTIADYIPAPAPCPDEAVILTTVQAVLTAVADRARDHRRAWVLAARDGLTRTDIEIAAARGTSRQVINNNRADAIPYLRSRLTPAERFALSMTRSPDV